MMPLWYHYMDENGLKINSDGETDRQRETETVTDSQTD